MASRMQYEQKLLMFFTDLLVSFNNKSMNAVLKRLLNVQDKYICVILSSLASKSVPIGYEMSKFLNCDTHFFFPFATEKSKNIRNGAASDKALCRF